ncbi:MAG: hypothetical protein R2882_14055 [Gemmatimonadales bacterium]
MPLDEWMPAWDARSAHETRVDASPERTFAALVESDFGRNPLVVALMAVRLLPAAIVAPRRTLGRWRDAVRARNDVAAAEPGPLAGGPFVVLSRRPPTELAFGLTGRFWTLDAALQPSDPATFGAPPPTGYARALWGFTLEPLEDGATRLRTETRVRAGDPATSRTFLRYWRLIRIGSGVMRFAILRRVKRRAERGVVPG